MDEKRRGKRRSLANLRKPWTKADHPRGGRPRGSISLVGALKRYLEDHPQDVEAIGKAWAAAAKRGKPKHLEMAVDRIDGKEPDITSGSLRVVVEYVENGGANGTPEAAETT